MSVSPIPTVILTTILILALSSCSEEYADKEKRLIDLVADTRLGEGASDYWLEMRGTYFTGEWYKVALIFGMGNDDGDREVCQEIANFENKIDNGSSIKWRCVAANGK